VNVLLEERKDENSAAVVLLAWRGPFHVEDGHPLDLAAEAAVVQESRPSSGRGAAAVCPLRQDSN
jgi:hypothetical protein